MSLSNYKSELVQSVSCEIDMLKKGNFKCADTMLGLRHQAQLRVYIIECIQAQETPNQAMINYLYEQVKEITRFIVSSNCVRNSGC